MSSGMAASAEVIHSFSTKDGNFDDIARHNVISTAGVDREGRQVVVFFACRLPDKNQIDHDRLLLYTIHTLSTIVESDYSLVYFHHGLNSANKPGKKIEWIYSFNSFVSVSPRPAFVCMVAMTSSLAF